MTDPYRALYAPVTPTDPDPVFAHRLRARLERALAQPPGVSMSISTSSTTSPASYRHGDTGYAWLSVRDVRRAEAFFGTVLGWTTTPGSVAEGSQVQGTTPSQGLHGGEDHPTLNCCYAVGDIEAAVARVRDAGGEAGEPSAAPYGLVANCRDDQGTVFALYQPPAGGGERSGQQGSRQGDLVYITVEVVDSAKARAFYGAVLGWRFTPGGLPDGWQVPDTVPMTGMHGGHARATTLPMWQVDDMAAAVARVRTAGGRATEPQQRPYGVEAECTDDQGTRFYLGQF